MNYLPIYCSNVIDRIRALKSPIISPSYRYTLKLMQCVPRRNLNIRWYHRLSARCKNFVQKNAIHGNAIIRRRKETVVRAFVRKYLSLRDIFDPEEKPASIPYSSISSSSLFPMSGLASIRSQLASDIKLPTCKFVRGRYVTSFSSDKKSLFDVFRYFLWRRKQEPFFADILESEATNILPTVKVEKKLLQDAVDCSKSTLTWLGHATTYYQTQGLYFLTDPIWSDYAGPAKYIGPKRFAPPPIELEELQVDYVLLSHTHYDHYDIPTAKRIGNKAKWIVPLGCKEMLNKIGITNCVELNWWESHDVLSPNGMNVEIMLTPTKHWSSRTPFDRNQCLWGGFAVMCPQNKYFFCGDTAYSTLFKDIGELFGPFDMAAIPIGAYSPRWFLKNSHCDPGEALQIRDDLRAIQSIAIHWGTFPMSYEHFIEPALELARVRDTLGLKKENFFTMAHGETVELLNDKAAYSLNATASNANTENQNNGSREKERESALHDLAYLRTDLYERYLDELRMKPKCLKMDAND